MKIEVLGKAAHSEDPEGGANAVRVASGPGSVTTEAERSEEAVEVRQLVIAAVSYAALALRLLGADL